MMKTHSAELVKLFNVSVEVAPDSRNSVDYVTLNKHAMQVGYIVHPQAANKATKLFIESVGGNINATFYKNFEEVTSKTRFELFIDQLLHYVTTYGTGFACEGNGYVPNDTPVGPVAISLFREYKVIMPCTEQEMFERCVNLCSSGVALKSSTVATVVDYILDYCKTYGKHNINIDEITNREAMTLICDGLNIAPNRKFDLLRYIIYRTTNETMLIKNAKMIRLIQESSTQFDFHRLDARQLQGLASIFYRFKPLFLAFKKTGSPRNYWSSTPLKTSRNAAVINKIRRMAKKYHEPLPVSIESTLLSSTYSADVLMETAAKMNNFQLIRILNTIQERMLHTNEKKMYVIRNGKLFISDGKSYEANYRYYDVVFNIFVKELAQRLSTKACFVKYPKGVTIACPTSEKNFVGDYPFGSKVDVGENDSFVGVYWRNEWGTRDFDLSVLDLNGCKIGWNSAYYNDSRNIVYSGDMTNASPEASEIMLFKAGAKDGSIMINRYNGNDGSKFRFFAGVEPKMKLTRNYMVDPKFVKVSADCISDSREQMIGLLNDGTLYFMTLGSGTSIVSYNRHASTNERFYATALKAKSYLPINGVLSLAGFVDVDTVEELPEDATVLDLTQLSRDTLINLFA